MNAQLDVFQDRILNPFLNLQINQQNIQSLSAFLALPVYGKSLYGKETRIAIYHDEFIGIRGQHFSRANREALASVQTINHKLLQVPCLMPVILYRYKRKRKIRQEKHI